MTQEEKDLVIKDLCGRLPYGVKVLYKGWDSDHGCEFNTVEDLIGIDDRFIYTLWRGERDKHSIVEPLSITDYKPYLRPLSSMTEEERNELRQLMNCDAVTDCSLEYAVGGCVDYDDFLVYYEDSSKLTDWLNKKMFDYRELIPKGLALETPEGMYDS